MAAEGGSGDTQGSGTKTSTKIYVLQSINIVSEHGTIDDYARKFLLRMDVVTG